MLVSFFLDMEYEALSDSSAYSPSGTYFLVATCLSLHLTFKWTLWVCNLILVGVREGIKDDSPGILLLDTIEDLL